MQTIKNADENIADDNFQSFIGYRLLQMSHNSHWMQAGNSIDPTVGMLFSPNVKQASNANNVK